MIRTSPRRAAGTAGRRLTQSAGWIAAAFGTVHIAVAPLDTRDVWSQVVSEGWLNTFTLDKATSLAELERSETFWVTLGSFGAPMLVLGSSVVWSARHGHRVPGWLGWMVLGWSVPMVSVLPASPGWALPVVGGLIVLGDRERSRQARSEPDADAVPTTA
ncbi:hypothetical protein CLV30_102424 [Haloactinopolyspora alba]|uniref:Uncharacterized protein n=1 Tax=Haloactinopolyspora alba TaxID=648780 RepID=A0A2P8EC28_9ACTN|nr:DUF6463 family protein [Haloactinopolyspora alba]PSL07035.1 hypothetical protein CLV30_102424 [Haloactinopolyspora alba]